jgi:hypothetical protein
MRHKPWDRKQTGSQELWQCEQGIPQAFVVLSVFERAERCKKVCLSDQEEEQDRAEEENSVSMPNRCTLPQSQSCRYVKGVQSRGFRVTAGRLTQGFFLLVHEDGRVDEKTDGYIEIKYGGDLAKSV